uniref:SCP domain-containing protein n=1 Tax=Phlebotomus papatasi TaxID=29031 RepID=A0A1B0DJJ0_PHLPP
MFSINFWIIYVAVFAKSINSISPKDVDWCSVEKKYCKNQNHVGCFDPKTDDKFCPTVKLIDLTQEDKQKLLNRMNENRNRLSAGLLPGIPYQASRMMKVEWSETMEYLSQIELQRCKSSEYCRQVEDTGVDDIVRGYYSIYTDSINETELSFNVIDKYFNGIIASGFKVLQDRIKVLEFKLEVQSGHVQLYELTDDDYNYGVRFADQNLHRMGCAISSMLNYSNETDKRTVKFCCTLQYKYKDDHAIKIGQPCSECNLEGKQNTYQPDVFFEK